MKMVSLYYILFLLIFIEINFEMIGENLNLVY